MKSKLEIYIQTKYIHTKYIDTKYNIKMTLVLYYIRNEYIYFFV
jgi:hypothetical protein